MERKGDSRLESMVSRRPYSLGRFVIPALALLWTLVSGLAYAQQSGARQEPSNENKTGAVSSEKETQIRKLLDLTGAKQNAVNFGQQLGDYLKTMLQKSLPPGGRNEEIGNTLASKLRERLGSDELIARLVPIYDRAFSQDDLSGIIAFYETPPGHKLLETTPKVTEEANSVSEQWIKEMLPQIMGQMVEQYPELKQPDTAAPGEHPVHP